MWWIEMGGGNIGEESVGGEKVWRVELLARRPI
jgi:hypothetical protein